MKNYRPCFNLALLLLLTLAFGQNALAQVTWTVTPSTSSNKTTFTVSREVHSDFRLLTSDFPSGVYILRLINGENVNTQKIIVK